ncbi:MAG: ABC transporter permease [Anaerolineae bacterium]|nr:ABC transporter permease [Anaerolineae bacterium]
MLRFLIERLLYIAAVSVIIVFFVFLGMNMAKNSEIPDPNYDLITQGKTAWYSTQVYLTGVLAGDFGTFIEDGNEILVKDRLKDSYLNSMGLLLVSLFIAALIGLSFGGLIALIKYRFVVLPLLTLTILGVSIPSFFGGLMMRHGILTYRRLVGPIGLNITGMDWDLSHMLLPVIVLSARPIAYLTRSAFVSLSQVMQEDYIRTAFSKGLRYSWIIFVHALRNIAVPVLTAVGVSLRFSLSSLPVIEYLFIWKGIGYHLFTAINDRQVLIVATLALALGLTFQLVNLFLDLIYRIIDPRVREIS